MHHKVKKVFPLQGFKLGVQFSEGTTKIYDIKPLFDRINSFKSFQDNPASFFEVQVDVGGYGIVWSDTCDLSCAELWDNGCKVEKPFVI